MMSVDRRWLPSLLNGIAAAAILLIVGVAPGLATQQQNTAKEPVELEKQVAQLREQLDEVKKNQRVFVADMQSVQRATAQFGSELAMIGADVEQIKRNVRAQSSVSSVVLNGYLCVTSGNVIRTFKVERNGKIIRVKPEDGGQIVID